MSDFKIDEVIRQLQELKAEHAREIAELKNKLFLAEKAMAEHTAAAANPDVMDQMETRQITREQVMARAAAKGGTTKVDPEARALKVLGAALPKVGRSAQLREVLGRAIRYYIKTPVTETFKQLLEGERAVEGKVLGPDGRKLEDGELLEDTASTLGLGIGLGSRGIALRDRRLNIERKYKDIMLSSLRHYMDDALEAKLTEMLNNIGACVEDQLRGLVPELPRE